MARRSWRPALFVTGVSVAAPFAAVELVWGLSEAAGYRAATSLSDGLAALRDPTALTLTVVLPAVLFLIASVSATIGWAGGVWALVAHTVTGRPVDLKYAYRYGLSRLRPPSCSSAADVRSSTRSSSPTGDLGELSPGGVSSQE
ncbi:hypothetical protein ABZT28_35585 [Streptomyces sp. NPDC005388]|uniref:hypothetical protein n=1 Tax=Streptomyces sp. NPDC005388 TaxID=3156717 RepID=UPI0033B1BAFD